MIKPAAPSEFSIVEILVTPGKSPITFRCEENSQDVRSEGTENDIMVTRREE